MENKKVKVGITQGDINGISYELIIKTFQDKRMLEFCVPVVYGSPKVASYHRKALDINNFNFNTINNAYDAVVNKANIINCLDDNIKVDLGKSTQMASEAALISLERATDDLKAGKIDVLVSSPLDIEKTQVEALNFKGYTQFFKGKFEAKDAMVLMVSDFMKVGVVSGNVPFSEVKDYITPGNIGRRLKLMHKTLEEDFVMRKPRIAVLGLNPNTDGGESIGKEETEVIIPAIKKANELGILALGPFYADDFFGSGSFKKFDAILAMYHDQGIAPFKALNSDEGINYTAGLPAIHTAPDCKVEFEIAGMGKASENSFRQAIYLACNTFHSRKMHKEISANPLKSQSIIN